MSAGQSSIGLNMLAKIIALLAMIVIMAILALFLYWGTDIVAQRSAPDPTIPATQDILGDNIGVTDIDNHGRIVPTTSPVAPALDAAQALPGAERTIAPAPTPTGENPPPAQTNVASAEEILLAELELERLRLTLQADIAEDINTRNRRKEAMAAAISPSIVALARAPAANDQSAVHNLQPSLVLAQDILAPTPASAGQADHQAGAALPPALSSALPAAFTVYSRHRKTAAKSPYELKKGTVIPGVLVTEINSDIPGSIIGMTRLDVYDSVTGAHRLIPSGSRLFGFYDPNVAYAQRRINVTWTHLVFPNGDTVILEDQQANDVAGRAGFADKRQGHFLRNLGGNLLYSILNIGETAAQARIEREINGVVTPKDGTADAIASLGSQLGGGGTVTAASVFNDQQSRLQPTLKIRSGYRFNILVAKDLILEPS